MPLEEAPVIEANKVVRDSLLWEAKGTGKLGRTEFPPSGVPLCDLGKEPSKFQKFITIL
jgi:hypothetical protein